MPMLEHAHQLPAFLVPMHELISMLTHDIENPYQHFGSVETRKFKQYLIRKAFPKNKPSDVLLVSHMDTVQNVTCTGFIPKPAKEKAAKNWSPDQFFAAGLDDRLGCYLGERISRELNCDHLICDDEETGDSSAEQFARDHSALLKQYNLIIELDRAGTDVVTYGYDSKEWNDLLRDYFGVIGIGAFSDICSFELSVDIDQCMCNVGVGYYDAHSPTSYCRMKEVETQYHKVKKFIAENRNKRYEADEVHGKVSDYDDYWYDDEDELLIVECPVCNEPHNIWTDFVRTCRICGHNLERLVEEAEEKWWANCDK